MCLDISIFNDKSFEPDERFLVQLNEVDDSVLIFNESLSITEVLILDDDDDGNNYVIKNTKIITINLIIVRDSFYSSYC